MQTLTLITQLGSLGFDLGQHFVIFLKIKHASDYTSIPGHNREFKQQRWQWQPKHHFKLNIWEMVTINFCDYCFFLPSFIVDRACYKWTCKGAIEIKLI